MLPCHARVTLLTYYEIPYDFLKREGEEEEKIEGGDLHEDNT